jgi:hypothetical protein
MIVSISRRWSPLLLATVGESVFNNVQFLKVTFDDAYEVCKTLLLAFQMLRQHRKYFVR